MPGNREEKEKCLEKLNHMQKYLPFLDFMIDKIKKKNNESSLKCQLSKFQVLRSMIAEKNGRYSWEEIIKVEDVIKKLISKLDFKGQNEKSKETLANSDNQKCKTNIATSNTKAPPTRTVSVTPSSQTTAADFKPSESSTGTVGLIMKTLKVCAEKSMRKSTETDKQFLANSLGPHQPLDVSGKTLETDLDKDLDGFDLSDSESGNSGMEGVISAAPEKGPSHDDLLSSSREKLLKSLQCRLLPCKGDLASPKSSASNKSDKPSESQSISASSRNHATLGEVKSGCDFSESGDHNAGDKKSRRTADIPDPGKPIPTPIPPKSAKSFSLAEKTRSDSTSNAGDANLKQRLKEKLSTDICEVYRVPGKSVGGSLRSLKEYKNRRKSLPTEEDDLFKPDRIIEKSDSKCAGVSQSKSCPEKKDDKGPRAYLEASASGAEKKDGSEKKTSQKCDATGTKQDGKTGHKQVDKNSKSTESKPPKSDACEHDKTVCKEYLGPKERKKQALKKEGEGKNPQLDKLNDEELVKFVKENVHYLPHLAKLKPSDIRKAIQSSPTAALISPLEVEPVSEKRDESFHDSDVIVISAGKTCGQARTKSNSNAPRNVEEPHPSGAEGVGKNSKPIAEASREAKPPDDVGVGVKSDGDDNADEQDYAQRLIEETTPSVATVKRKGLLQLPMPVIDDLFDDISSIESFETSNSSNESGDPRLALPKFYEKRITAKNKSESAHQVNANQCNVGGGVRHGLTGRDNPPPPKDYSQCARGQTSTGPVTAPAESHRTQRTNQNRPDPWPSKSLASHSSQDVNQYPQLSNRYSIETGDSSFRNAATYSKTPANPSFNNSLRRQSYSSGEPKSYAEYKRLKLKGKEKLNQQETTAKENAKSITPESGSVSEISRSPAERDDADRTTSKKCLNPRRTKDSHSKQAHVKSYHPGSASEDRKRPPNAGQRRYSDHVDSRSREERKSHEETGRIGEDKRHSTESEELVSPLEELYRDESKPKTGRGYGIQYFKIPKKARESQCSSKPNESQTHGASVDEGKTQTSNARNGAESAKDSKEPARIHPYEVESEAGGSGGGNAVEEIRGERGRKGDEKSERRHIYNSGAAKDIPGKGTENVEPNKAVTKTESSIVDCTNDGGVDSRAKAVSSETGEEAASGRGERFAREGDEEDGSGRVENAESKIGSNPSETEIGPETPVDPGDDVTKRKSKLGTVKKCEAEIAECDSSVEYSGTGEQTGVKEATPPGDKGATVPKEEITQEFVEALIRKSFQSGEGKLLLAHAKLFEEFARKLNSKKLKTIQRIINSETDISSSSSEGSSEDERKRKKGKKGEEKSQKTRKPRRRGRRSKRQKSSSSSCLSCESEESSGEGSCDRKEERNENKQREISGTAAGDEDGEIEQRGGSEEYKCRNPDSVPVKASRRTGKRRRNADFGKNFSGRKAKRKQQQKKLLEEILNETPHSEASQDTNASNPGDASAKESEPKSRPKTKGKAKTELDRLHDDIRNMFLNAGVVTQTGQRMCRILRQSGGNINNVDIVKESAKMVEEEKLKKVHTRSSAKNPRAGRADSADSRSRSQSLDKTSKSGETQQENEDGGAEPKLTKPAKVVLQRVDLNNFGYGVKVSEDCISFRRLRGRNTAIRGSRGVSKDEVPLIASLVRNVYLPRNKRKVKRMREAKYKKEYVGKKLVDVVKNLPLKMAKMKHLQISEKKEEQPEATKRKKYCSGKSPKKSASRKNKSDLEFSNAELLNYAFERIRVMYSCKLCSQVTRYITGHYKVVHPEHEVLISRLCMGEAKRARLDAKRNRYNDPVPEENPLAEAMKRKMKTLLSCSNSYNCRMCSSVKTQDLEVFKAHVSSHTGEFRFQCPAEGCNVKTYSFQDIKIHILTKHGKNRAEYNKVNELYTIVVEGGKMFGFLCSICNFVQLYRDNVMEHISRRHAASENPGIIKINMSANIPKAVKKKYKNIKSEQDAAQSCEDTSNVEKLDEGSGEDTEVSCQKRISGESSAKVEDSEEEECKEQDQSSEGEGREAHKNDDDDDGGSGVPTRKRRAMENAEDMKEGDDEGGDEEEEEEEDEEKEEEEEEEVEDEEEEVEMEEGEESVTKKARNATPDQSAEKETDEELTETVSDNEGKGRADPKKVSTRKGSGIADSVGSPQRKDGSARSSPETVEASQKLKVGPLRAQLLENSTVLYECYVKGCLFFTEAFNLFERHIRISHCKTKWEGICEICNAGKDAQPNGDNSFKLLTALKHLRLHEREKISDGKLSKEELIMELKLLNSSEDCVDDEETDKADKDAESPNEAKEEDAPSTKMTENADTPYPPKPLLRVRNLLGDRLSTPKESPEENKVVAISEEPPTSEPQPNSMFTIENVRSLNDAPPEESEIQIQHVCSLKDSPKSLPPLASGKTILVRSCPTRKIAIRPEPSAVSIDVGQLSVVQAPPSSHPVVLGPLATTSPIRIISSSALSPKPKFTVKPILVSADAGRINTPNVLSIISPTLSPIVPSTAVTTETSKGTAPAPVLPESSSTNQVSTGPKPSLDVTVVPSPSKPATPAATSTSLIDVDDVEEKDTITLQRIHSSPNVGNKRVKDAKIYEEMLTKTKLCHLFKCMGIECSFTCNNECVFRQHIGLHEAQRRLKKNKGIRTIFLRLANKTTRAFYWQQCAYCCELLTNTNNALSQHILEEHGHCMYQCAFCFYRAVSHSYVEIHQNLAHSQILKTTPRVIYKCKPLRTPPSQVAALVKHGRRQSVRPYHCDQCGRKFFITQDFIKHLTTQHQSVTAYTCHICKNLCFKADRLVVHYKLHSYCTYQCAYCLHGTETEKEMVFHLCNFHFSQPAIMYVRAFADGQSHDVKEKQMKKKKHLSNQLDSLKVIVYESDTLSADCIVEVDADEETPENASEANTDLSAIVAELGINADVPSQPCVTPLMKELASIGDKNAKNLTVKTLLPNAQFSSENENGGENCSVLISSGLSTPSDQSNERAMNIPLGQLPLEVVNVQHNERTVPSRQLPAEVINVQHQEGKNISSPDRNLKLSEIIENIQNKDKAAAAAAAGLGGDEQKQPAVISSAVHKLPPVVLSRSSASKNVYSSKSAMIKKKSEEAAQPSENPEGEEGEGSAQKSNGEAKERRKSPRNDPQDAAGPGEGGVRSVSPSCAKKKGSAGSEKGAEEPLVSLVSSDLEKEPAGKASSPLVISDICSLSGKTDAAGPGIVINVQPKVNSPIALKPPIIRVEDFPIGEESKASSGPESADRPAGDKKDGDKESEKSDATRSNSPDIIILEEEKSNDIITVTLDSDDEKEENHKKEVEKESKREDEGSKSSFGGDTIRKEMELLRNQIANETDSLLFDEAEGEKAKEDLSLSIEPESESSPRQSLLSPIEEAICSLNKKLQSETEQAQKKEEESKKEVEEASARKADACASEMPERPRTRFAARDKRKEGGESAEKSDGDEGGVKKEGAGKWKKGKEDLVGKELFICGNENCTFAADDDLELKDHLYVCDLSRESSVLVCPHCSRQMKQFHPYLEHLKYHGQKKYHCGLCEYSSPVDANVTRHVKQKHKCSLLKVLPKDSQPGHLAYYPKNYKVDKVDFEVNGYSPGDEDKLPLQSVYQVNVKCAKCPYFTKVRSNMVRHLKIHVKSVETEGVVVVPSTAPTNPVPCLETKERMFDKMTNLAASSQLAQAKEKAVIESLSSEEAAKLPHFVAEQMRYKCCLPDCNYITVDEGMLRHHIKALHDEINYYSCPHCQDTVHVDVRHVTLDKIGHHLKHHDSKLYKCAHCIYFHYQKNMVEKHTAEKHPDRRYFVHTVREPKPEGASEEETSAIESGPRVWKCGLCEGFRSPSKTTLMDHLLKTHNIKSKYRCKLCSMKGNSYQAFLNHFASKHPGEKVSFMRVYLSEKGPTASLESGNSSGADSSSEHFDTTPLWQRGTPRIRHIRGILIEEEEIKTKKIKRASLEESEAETSDGASVNENAFYCPLCTNKKKPFFTRSEDCFRTHLYQELNYQQFACILCGKMFVDRKDFDKHHARVHPDKSPAVKQTKEDHEIKFWVDQVIAKRQKQMEEKKRKLSDGEGSGNQGPAKKKKEV